MNSQGQRLDRLAIAHCFRAAPSKKPEGSLSTQSVQSAAQQPQFHDNGLKAPWRAPGTYPHLKDEEPRV